MSETSSSQRSRRPAAGWLLPLVVPLVLAIAAVAAFLAAEKSINDQETRILRERTSEVELILSNTIANIPSSLRALGVAARLGDAPESAFLSEARATPSATGAEPDVALVRMDGDTPVVAAALGRAPATGSRLTGQRAEVVRRALRSPELAPTEVFRDGDSSRLGFAVGPPTTPPGTVIYQEAPISPEASQVGQQDAFHEIKAIIYATAQPRPDQIVIATTPEKVLKGDDVARGSVPIGDRKWLLLTSPREPLVGSFATAVPWIVLGGGLLGAALAGVVIVVLLRRRDYALELVDERTGELRQSLGALEDAQSRLVLQERLAAIGQVAAAVGHELRNPLGVLTNALYLVRARVPESEREAVGRHLDIAEREVAASANIVESLLDFAREREPATASVDLADLLEEALSVAPPPADVRVERRIETLPSIRADRQQLRQVLLNLLTNGYEAMDGSGTLTLDARPVNGHVELRVADTGTGMDPETAARVFEPFFTTKAKGIGLGLPVTKRIMEMHGGTIVAESEAGAGTTFVLTVPVMVDGAS
jgi:signal transduction histidine kinase